MRKDCLSRVLSLTQHIIEEYWQGDLNPLKEHLHRDILWIGAMDEEYLHGAEAMLSRLDENQNAMPPVFLDQQEYSVVLNGEGTVLYGYHQSLKETHIVLREDDSQKLIAAMNRVYFCSYYIDLAQDEYYTFKATVESGELESQEGRASVAIRNFVRTLVHPKHKAAMLAFVELNTLDERISDKLFVEQEYISITDKGWCRARFIPVDWDDNGRLSHVQFVIASIDRTKRIELEREKSLREAAQLQRQLVGRYSKWAAGPKHMGRYGANVKNAQQKD